MESPTARSLRTLELIQVRPGITADGLATRLEVTPRAVRRYVAILREAGIVVDSLPGRGGGYRVGRGMRRAPIVFTAEEVLSLVMAVLEAADDDSAVGEAMTSAVDKLLQTLPSRVSTPALVLREGAAADSARRRRRPDPVIALALIGAADEHRSVRIGYRLPDGRQLERTVEPWAVVVRHGLWYLLCRSVEVDETRAYRVDRITALEETRQPFEPPAPFDATELLEAHLSAGWPLSVSVRIEAPVEQVQRWLPKTAGRLTPLDEAVCLLVGSTSNPHGYAADLAQVPADLTVVEGSEVREAVAVIARRLARAADPESLPDGSGAAAK